MIREIEDRRSIRKYLDISISKEDIKEILESAIKAPSAKNRQPWKFIVVQGNAKDEVMQEFRKGLFREENGDGIFGEDGGYLNGAKETAKIMEQAPVIIFVLNTYGRDLMRARSVQDYVFDSCNIQSISAAIENMLLAATEKGIGSLWIADIYYAYFELLEWLGGKGELIAAVALGYPTKIPPARPRKDFNEVVEWRD